MSGGRYHGDVLFFRRLIILLVDVEREAPVPDGDAISIVVCLEQRISYLVVSGVCFQLIWETLLGKSQQRWCGNFLDHNREIFSFLWVQWTYICWHAFLR